MLKHVLCVCKYILQLLCHNVNFAVNFQQRTKSSLTWIHYNIILPPFCEQVTGCEAHLSPQTTLRVHNRWRDCNVNFHNFTAIFSNDPNEPAVGWPQKLQQSKLYTVTILKSKCHYVAYVCINYRAIAGQAHHVTERVHTLSISLLCYL